MNVYMISMSDNPVSQYYANTCKKTWESLGYHITDFEAITPKTLGSCNELQFGYKLTNDEEKEFTPTEKSIWYSHYYLWQKCIELNQPIVVIEHDCYLFDQLPETFDFCHFFTKNVSKKIIFKGAYGRISPAAGYMLSVEFAKALIEDTKKELVHVNVDGHIYHISGDIAKYYDDINTVAIQLVDDDLGTTIYH